MPVTLATARAALRERLDEASARQWSDTSLERWLHEGAKELARSLEVLQAEEALDVDAAEQRIALPADAVRVHRATWQADNDDNVYPLRYMDFHSADAVWWTQSEISQGTPELFTMWGVAGAVQAILYPTPAVNGTLTVYYYRLPVKPVEEADTYDLPEGWEDTMYVYAEMMALRQDRDPRWQEAKALFEEQKAVLEAMSRRHTDQLGSFVDPELPMVNAWLYAFD